MKLRVVNLVLVTCLLAIAVTTAQETFKVKDGKAETTKVGTAAASVGVKSHRRELTFRQRQQLGLTISGVRDAHKTLKESGQITDDMSSSEVSVEVLAHIQKSNEAAFSANANLDWEAIIAWIEKILEILKLFF